MLAQSLEALGKIILFGTVLVGGTEAVGAQLIGDAAAGSKGLLKAISQCREAFSAVHHLGISPATGHQPIMEQSVPDKLTSDKDRVSNPGKIGDTQSPQSMGLGEYHILAGSV